MVDDPSKLFAFNYRAKDHDNMMYYNVRRWDKGIVISEKTRNGLELSKKYSIQPNTRHGTQRKLTLKGVITPLKLKKLRIKGTKLNQGTIQVMCYGFADNIIVYVDFKDVEAKNKLTTTTWSHQGIV